MELVDICERYVQINGFEDYYITESGKVYSTRLRCREILPRLRELKPKDPGNPMKYLNIILCNANGHYTFSIHRLVAQYFVDGYFDGAVVNHIDGNNRNNHYSNLEWVSQKTNINKSYATSHIDQTRNYLWWILFDKDNNILGEFKGHRHLEAYVKENLPSVSASSLIKYGKCNGYYIKKIAKQ